ncbi:hypothetical protein [Variovorax boronicumulans]|uniref:Nmad2 family putative nucleotide modification protein n=1 Tax=Variovorax boronicumulans TaxID=436515 RepID=UPI00339261E6
MRVYSYKLTRDYGFAPNPFNGVCTLATCKPQVRTHAKVGDLVFGCGSSELNLADHLIFALQVEEKLTFDQYWNDERFFSKRPAFNGSLKRAYGDNIYHKDGKNWVQADSHHSLDHGELNTSNLNRDTGSDNVLISSNFVYWGGSALKIPLVFLDFEGDSLYPGGRPHRSIFSDSFTQALYAWFSSISLKGCRGRPGSWPAPI